jgi:hypothetical protein
VKTLVWNCNGLSSDKRLQGDFVDFLCGYDLIILSETWCDKNADLSLNGYECLNVYRAYRHRRAKRHSGGIAVFYKTHLGNGIKLVKKHHDTLVWLKLDKDFFFLE